MNEALLLATLLFSETKDLDDAEAIASVVMNRLKKPERFGATLQDVIYAPYQFSGVDSNEWNKVVQGKLNADEEKIFKQFLRISHSTITGNLEDKTNGADHYVNLKLSRPSWSRVYQKTAKVGQHTYFKEVPINKRKGERNPQ